MNLKEDTPLLFLRLGSFMGFDTIDEHRKVINDKGFVWMLKIGRKINESYLEDIIKNNAGIILKKSSKNDKKLYYAKLDSINYDNSNVFPEYYYDFLSEYGYKISDLNKSNCNWFKVTDIYELNSSESNKIIVSKNGKSLEESAANSRTPYIFCSVKKDVK